MNIGQYISNVRTELTRVTWPSRAEALTYTGLVVLISVAVAAFTSTLDAGLLKFISSLTN